MMGITNGRLIVALAQGSQAPLTERSFQRSHGFALLSWMMAVQTSNSSGRNCETPGRVRDPSCVKRKRKPFIS